MVIPTHSIIIQNQKSMDSFLQHQPIFAEAISNKRISVCEWVESGTTIDTALPELNSLTEDKREWRAIIVRYLDGPCMASCETDPQNPYDFIVNKEPEDTIEESQVPLIRLTQMLGGLPPLEVHFGSEVIEEEYKSPRTFYVPIEDKERKRAHQTLEEKYQFDGKRPSSIILVTLQGNYDQEEENLDHIWKCPHAKKSERSTFWKRNHYPSICRFLVYDFVRHGPVQKDADDFAFWYSVLLLSTNEWDSGTLQAYRLYSLNLLMDQDNMTESFQRLANRLQDAKWTIERNIKRSIESQISDEADLPQYKVEVPVFLNLPKSGERIVDSAKFPLFSRGSNSDLAMWYEQKGKVEEELATSIRQVERALDRTADNMRLKCSCTEEEVEPLNKYQEEDLQRELHDLHRQIVDIQGMLPSEDVLCSDEMHEISENVRQSLLGRVMKGPAIISFIIVSLLILFSALPAFIQWLQFGRESILAWTSIVALGVLLAGLAAIGALVSQKAKLNSRIDSYNRYITGVYSQLVKEAGNYSDYMSNIASHSRGSSYRRLSKRKKHIAYSEYSANHQHMRAINGLLGRLKKWSRAFYLDVDFTSRQPEVRMDVDTSVSPIENKLYAFDVGRPHSVEVNSSGMTVEALHNFANRIEIVGEELYDDE